MSGRAVPRKKPTPSSISRSPASIARPRPANSSTPPSRLRPTAWSPPRPWRPSCCANGAASPARPRILGDLFDRLGLRRIRAARLGQQPDGLRLELRRVSRSFCHGSIISHRVRGNAEQKSVHISQAKTETAAANEIAHGTLWNIASKAPVYGDDITTVQGMTSVVDCWSVIRCRSL